MIRILHVFGKLNRGGAETMIMNLYRNVDHTQIQFDFVVHTEEIGDYESEILEYGGIIHRVPSYNGKNHLQYVSTWNKLFNNFSEYNIVHGHVRSTASIYLYISKQRGLITISHSHSTTSGSGMIANIKNIMQLPIRYIADYMVAPSEEAAIWLFGKKVLKKPNFFIIKNAIDTKKYVYNVAVRSKIRKKLNIENKFVIGHVGRFHELKNHKFLIEVFNQILQYNKDCVLVLIGEGELYQKAKEKVDSMGITEQVLFLGKQENVNDYYQAMDIFVFPSYFEGLGLVVVEAQAAGLKCIVSDSIPKEATISNLVVPLSLEKSLSYWAKLILENKNYYRSNNLQMVIDHHYDIKENAQFIQNFYKDIIS